MRHITIITCLAILTLTTACSAERDQKSGWFFGLFPPKQWPEEHWKPTQFQTDIDANNDNLPAAVNKKKSMFTPENTQGLTAEQLIENLQSADIIDRVYNRRQGVLQEKTSDIIVELDHNFYTLSQADQAVITDLLYRSYESPVILLKDRYTQKTIGAILDGTFQLY